MKFIYIIVLASLLVTSFVQCMQNNDTEEFLGEADLLCKICNHSLVHYDENMLNALVKTLKQNETEWNEYLSNILTTMRENYRIKNIFEELDWHIVNFRLQDKIAFTDEELSQVTEIINSLIANCYFCNKEDIPQFHSFCFKKSGQCPDCHQKLDEYFLELLCPPSNAHKKNFLNIIVKNNLKNTSDFNTHLFRIEKIATNASLGALILFSCMGPMGIIMPVLIMEFNNLTLEQLTILIGTNIFACYMIFFLIVTFIDNRVQPFSQSMHSAVKKTILIPLRKYLAHLRNKHRLTLYDIQINQTEILEIDVE